MVAIIHKRSWRDFDWILALLAIGIVLFGTIQIRNAQPTEAYWVKQLIGLSIGLVDARDRFHRLSLLQFAPAFYIFGLILLVIVLIPGIGLKINGQRVDQSLRHWTVSAVGVCEGHHRDDAGALLRGTACRHSRSKR